MEKNNSSVEYLKNVLISWDEFCKQHSKFEVALKDVLEENERLKVKHQTEPKKLQLRLTFKKEMDGVIKEIYSIGKYTVVADWFAVCGVYIAIGREDSNRYLPYICANKNSFGKITGFTIETTSYGALSSEEITKVINGLREAQEVVEILKEKFLNK